MEEWWLSEAWAFEHAAAPGRLTLGRRLGGGSNGAVFAATLEMGPGRRRIIAAKTHHALRDPAMYGLDDPTVLRGVLDEISRELRALSIIRGSNLVESLAVSSKDEDRRRELTIGSSVWHGAGTRALRCRCMS